MCMDCTSPLTSQTKCHRYWPGIECIVYSEIAVEMVSENEKEDWTVREFRLSMVRTLHTVIVNVNRSKLFTLASNRACQNIVFRPLTLIIFTNLKAFQLDSIIISTNFIRVKLLCNSRICYVMIPLRRRSRAQCGTTSSRRGRTTACQTRPLPPSTLYGQSGTVSS